ncbi:hypothetical protein J6590_057956 [Homalodisca vitripennis]|nr:hypothetical protein J6590_057956 [Homalodisca vitripennis]
MERSALWVNIAKLPHVIAASATSRAPPVASHARRLPADYPRIQGLYPISCENTVHLHAVAQDASHEHEKSITARFNL